jgi:hypothetical protein
MPASVRDPIDVDVAELRLFAQFAALPPDRLALALNEPEHWNRHLSGAELGQLTLAAVRFAPILVRLAAILSRRPGGPPMTGRLRAALAGIARGRR